MKILPLLQGSEEWLKARLGVATASNFSKIITSTGKESTSLSKYALELATEKMLIEPEESYENIHIRNGKEREPIARQLYCETKLCVVEEVGFIVSDCGDFGYSPDGLVGDKGLIEIKCPMATTHAKYLIDDKLPSDYVAQVQGGLFVSGREWCDFVSFHNNFQEDKKLFVKRIFRDEEFIKSLKVGLEKVVNLRNQYLEKLK